MEAIACSSAEQFGDVIGQELVNRLYMARAKQLAFAQFDKDAAAVLGEGVYVRVDITFSDANDNPIRVDCFIGLYRQMETGEGEDKDLAALHKLQEKIDDLPF